MSKPSLNRPLTHKPGLALVFLLGCLLLPFQGVAAGSKQPVAETNQDGWRLGVVDIPSPAPAGAKARTPLRLEVLAGQTAPGAASLQAVSADQAARQISRGELDAWIGVIPDSAVLPSGVQRQALGWSVSPMAIMRTDTQVHDWPDLAGRTVCLSADSRFIGDLSARFGAIEQVSAFATDALLGVRIGQCDAVVADEGFLQQLLKFPEWQKFSARLKPYRTEQLVRLQRTDLPAAHDAGLKQATDTKQLLSLARIQAKDIAFEVYLDQTVPDCH